MHLINYNSISGKTIDINIYQGHRHGHTAWCVALVHPLASSLYY